MGGICSGTLTITKWNWDESVMKAAHLARTTNMTHVRADRDLGRIESHSNKNSSLDPLCTHSGHTAPYNRPTLTHYAK